MRMFAVVSTVVLFAAGPVVAQTPDPTVEPDPVSIEELERRLDILAEEIERLRSGEPDAVEVSDARRRELGLAPSAAATYERTSSGVSIAGYGEMLIQNFADQNESGAGGGPTTQFDFLRAILYAGYRFNDEFLFSSEIEVEHAEEVFVEFAYLDYMPTEHLTIRGGMVLIPLGLVNEFHEPTVFLGARRPQTETRIIPSTWRENGGGVLGTVGPVSYRMFVTNGLRGAGFTSAGLRGGRQKGSKAAAANLAVSGRLDVTLMPGIFAGIGIYQGSSGQDEVILESERLTVGTTVAEVHGQAQVRGFDVRALFAHASVDRAGDASRALGVSTSAPIASAMQGGYLQIGYDLLSQTAVGVALTPYARYERVDTQHEVPSGFTRDLSRDGRFLTLGVEVKPIPNVVVKADYQWITNQAGSGRNQFNVNLGYAF